MTSSQRTAVEMPANGLIVFDTEVQRLYQYQDGIWRTLLNNTYWAKPANSNNMYNTSDNIGIGTAAPLEKLHLSNGNFRLSGGNIDIQNGEITMNKTDGTIQLQNAGVNKAFFQLSGEDLRFGTNSGNTAGNVIIRMNGGNHFQFTQHGRLSLIADQTPTLYFNTGGINRAYLQLQGDNIKIDAPGNRVFVGDDVVVDDATGRIGMGTLNPEQKLHVQGEVKISTGKVLNNDNMNMMPIAMGYFDANGAKIKGTSNISAVRKTANDSFRYFEIVINGLADAGAVIVSATGTGPQLWASARGIPGTNKVSVYIYDNIVDDETTWSPFHIIIYN
jgi:hypothetical protein